MRSEPAVRWVCMLLILCAVQTCGAAVMDEATGTLRPSLAVLDFHDFSDYRGHLLGRRVALELHRALAATGRWSLIEPDRVAVAMADMDVHPPFAVGYQQALANRLKADITVTGRIEGARTDAGGSRVSVRLIVDFVERIAGQSVMPMTVEGTSASTAGPLPADIRVDAAIADACAQVVASAASTNHSRGMVVGVTGKELALDTGLGTALMADDRVLIYRVRSGPERSADPVAVALVKTVNGEKAVAIVFEKERDVYTDDVAVCIGPPRKTGGGM